MRPHISQVSWNRRRLAIAAMLVVLGNPAVVFADQASDVAALEAKCEAEREAKIKPLRDVEIAKCKADQNNDPGYCERFWKDGKTMAIRCAAPMAERSRECSATCRSASRHSKPAKR